MTDTKIGCVQHDCTDCKKRDAEIERLRGHIKHIGNDALRAENHQLRARLAEIAAQEPVAYQFQTLPDGKWHDFLDDWHYRNTVKDGRWPIRALFTAPVAQPANTGINPLWVATHPDNLQQPAEPVELTEVIEALCARIKAADDAAADRDYMLDSDDCIAVIRGTWKAPLMNDKPVKQGVATEQPAEPMEPQEVVLTYNYSTLVKVEIAGVVNYEVDLSPLPYFQVCWAHGWAGTYSSEDEANEECINLCGYSRSTRMIKPTDEGYQDQRDLQLTEKRIPVLAASAKEPAEPVELTDAEIELIADSVCAARDFELAFARAILEAAKGGAL